MSEQNFHVYKSSAGSGKTYTLVREYLSVALESESPSRYRNILAITFTNKAASEMKERVTKYLKMFSNPTEISGGEKDMFKFLMEELCINEKELSKRAFLTLQSILHNYSDFNITTIDKFILRIIRSFSFDLQLPYNFEVELDGDGLLSLAINNLIAETGKDKKLTAFLVNYIKQLADSDESWDIQKSLLNIAKLSLNEGSDINISKLKEFSLEHFVKIKEETQLDINKYEKYIAGRLDQGKDLILTKNLTANEFKGKSSGSVWSYFNKKRESSVFTDPAGVKNIGFFEEEEWNHKSAPEAASSLSEIKPQLYQFYSEIEAFKEKESAQYIVIKNINKQLFQLGLLNEIEKQILIIKEEKNFIHISEFNKKVAEIVIEQPIPFVYERIGEKFNNYLIDEFQDTSVLQWQNLLPLVENSLAYNNKNLIVGDTKQAIYRWRGGDVDQFAFLPYSPHFADNPIIQERTETLTRQFQAFNLNKNYRSLPNVIGFNNILFESLLENLPFDFSDYYDDYTQIAGGTKQGGYAEVCFVDKEDYDENTFQEILSTVNDCLARGFQLRDIAILARKNKLLAITAEFLTNNGIPVISSESLSLNQSAEVNFLVHIFRIITTPNDTEAYLKAANYLKEKASLDYFDMFSNSKEVSLKFVEFLKTKFNLDLPRISGLSLYESFEEIIYTFKISKSSPFIQTFLDVVNKHSKDSNSSEFIAYWEDKKHKLFIASPENIDAISLMSIHKSKGLEFDVVLLPFANNKGMDDQFFWINTEKLDINLSTSLASRNKALEKTEYAESFTAEKKKALLDELNTIYVAVTRAAKELYIFIKETRSEKDKKSALEINNIEKFFLPVIDRLEQNGERFHFGKKTIITSIPEQNHPKESEIELKTGGWRDKIKLSFSAPTIWNVPENSEESFFDLDPRNFGNLIHNIFARLDNNFEVEQTIQKMEKEGLIDKTNEETLVKLIEQSLQLDPLPKIWKTGKHIIEKEIITPDGTSYRPDRVIEFESTTYLIDFKTGSEKEKDKTQIRFYAKLLASLNFKNIQSFLIYTEENNSVEVNL